MKDRTLPLADFELCRLRLDNETHLPVSQHGSGCRLSLWPSFVSGEFY